MSYNDGIHLVGVKKRGGSMLLDCMNAGGATRQTIRRIPRLLLAFVLAFSLALPTSGLAYAVKEDEAHSAGATEPVIIGESELPVDVGGASSENVADGVDGLNEQGNGGLLSKEAPESPIENNLITPELSNKKGVDLLDESGDNPAAELTEQAATGVLPAMDTNRVGNARNLVLLVRFANDTVGDGSTGYNAPTEYASSFRTKWDYFTSSFNEKSVAGDSGVWGLRNYLYEVSGGKHDVVTDFPQTTSDGRVEYITLDQSANTFGINSEERFVQAAIAKFNQRYGDYDASRVDGNNDLYVDNVLVIASGVETNESTPFFSHKANMSGQDTKVGVGSAARTVYSYNIIPTTDSSINWGTVTHEYLHTLGAKDYYRDSDNGHPVGVWDIMASSAAQARLLAVTRQSLNWMSIAEKSAGSYTLSSTGLEDGQAIMLKSPLNDTEYFVVEYREKGFDPRYLDNHIDASGLVVYRVNPAYAEEGNFLGNDYVYVFRSGETSLGDAHAEAVGWPLSNAVVTASGIRTSIGVADMTVGITQGALCYSDGRNSGIVIEATSQTNDSITFDISYPDYAEVDLWDSVISADGTNAAFGSNVAATQTVVDDRNVYVALDTWGAYQIMKYDGTSWSNLGTIGQNAYSGQLAVHAGEPYFMFIRDDQVELWKLVGSAWSKVASRSIGAGLTANQVAIESVGDKLYMLMGPDDSHVKLYRLEGTSLQEIADELPVRKISNPTLFELNGNPAVACGDSDAGKSYVFEHVGGAWIERSALDGGFSNKNSVAYDGSMTYVYQCLSRESSNTPKLLTFNAQGMRSSVINVPDLVSNYSEGSLSAANGTLYLTLCDGQEARAVAKTFTANVSDLNTWKQLGESVYNEAYALSSAVSQDKILVSVANYTTREAMVKSHDLVPTAPVVPNQHTVVFKADGKVVKEVAFNEGDAELSEVPAAPSKTGYSGAWEPYTLGTIDVIVNAIYTPKEYSITFKNWDDSVLLSSSFTFDGVVSAPIATRPDADGVHYTFTNWSPAFSGVCDQAKDMVYTARYSQAPIVSTKHTVTFMADGKEVKQVVFTEGDTKLSEVPAVPVKAGYTGLWEPYTLGTSDLTINARYEANTYTVTFKNWDGKVLSSGSYKLGEFVKAPLVFRPSANGREYTFTGWLPTFLGTCTGNAVYTTQYSSRVIEHTVTFVADGKTIATRTFNEVDKKLIGTEPAVPEKLGYSGAWESYALGTSNITVAAKYSALGVGWLSTNGTWYYVDRPGHIKTGWLSLGGAWYYLDPAQNGAMRTGSYMVGATLYHSHSNGAMVSGNGWVKTDGAWYYLSSSGAARTGWLRVGGAWYYLNPSTGTMATGWYRVGSTWYYSDSSGAMRTGWLKLGGAWYYLNGSGAMAVGWARVGGTWYYLNDSGAMATGWRQVGSTWYYLNGSGAMQTGWLKLGGTWYYLTGSGAMATNRWVGNYYLGASGAMATSGWIGSYYVGADGAWIPGRKR